jgi:hypothetical protein
MYAMKPHLIDPSSDLTQECYALIDAPSLKRKRFPENNVTVMGSEAEALAGADPANNIVPAVVFGPSRSSEGFRLFYLVRWLQ